jgi:hypothetical protein
LSSCFDCSLVARADGAWWYLTSKPAGGYIPHSDSSIDVSSSRCGYRPV